MLVTPCTPRTAQEQNKILALACKVKIPAGAPRVREWYVKREAVVADVCDRLGIWKSAIPLKQEPRMVGLSGTAGAGKSTAASMVVARPNVRACFQQGVLWLPVGRGAKDRLPALLLRLANMVYETVLQKNCRPPQRSGVGVEPEDGAAYISEMVHEGSRRYLVVADDVWDVEVLEELRRAGAWVLYTTRSKSLLGDNGDPPLQMDAVTKEEAATVLRRAAGLRDDVALPGAANEVMTRCGFVVMDLAFVGRWGTVRGRSDGNFWRMALDRIAEAQKKGGKEGGGDGEEVELLPWRTAVLRAGLEELALDNLQNKELYLSLAVLPKRLSVSSEDVAALLFGKYKTSSAKALSAAETFASTLERWSILTLEEGGKYRVHDTHSEFVRERIAEYPVTRDKALRRWRRHSSTFRALRTWPDEELVDIWRTFALVQGQGKSQGQSGGGTASGGGGGGGEEKSVAPKVARPYDAVLNATDPSDAALPILLRRVAYFHWLAGDPGEAHEKWKQLLAYQEENLGTSEHPDMALTLYRLGVCASAAGRMKEAEGWYRRALSIEEKKLGSDHPDVATTLHDLGGIAFDAGRPAEAEQLYRRALAIREEKLGPYHPNVAPTLYNLGLCASGAWRTEEAEQLFRKALAIREENLGSDHPDLADTLHQLAVCMLKRGARTEQAEGLNRRALAMREAKLGDDHPDVATSLYSLAVCALKSERLGEAEVLYRRALAIREEKLGADHQSVAATLQGLALCALEGGRAGEAEGLYRRALAIREEKLSANHPDVAAARYGLELCVSKAATVAEQERRAPAAAAVVAATVAGDEEKKEAAHGDTADVCRCCHEEGEEEGSSSKQSRACSCSCSSEGRQGSGVDVDAERPTSSPRAIGTGGERKSK